jgi:hypothetical protein
MLDKNAGSGSLIAMNQTMTEGVLLNIGAKVKARKDFKASTSKAMVKRPLAQKPSHWRA